MASSTSEKADETKVKDPQNEKSGSGSSGRGRAVPDIGFHSGAFGFSVMAGLLNDLSIKKMAKEIVKDPVFNQMAQQLQQQRNDQTAGQDGLSELDTTQYFFAMQKVMQKPEFKDMVGQLRNARMQDTSMLGILRNLRNPANKEQREARMAQIREDPSLDKVLKEIEEFGQRAMLRYWNDPVVLGKLGRAMRPDISELVINEEEAEEKAAAVEEEEELTVYHTASTGDVEALKAPFALPVMLGKLGREMGGGIPGQPVYLCDEIKLARPERILTRPCTHSSRHLFIIQQEEELTVQRTASTGNVNVEALKVPSALPVVLTEQARSFTDEQVWLPRLSCLSQGRKWASVGSIIKEEEEAEGDAELKAELKATVKIMRDALRDAEGTRDALKRRTEED